MLELIGGSLLTTISLLIGYSLGKNNQVVPNDVKRQINQIFSRVVPNPEVGPVIRPDAKQNFYRDNPVIAREHEVMAGAIDKLNK